MKVQNISYTYTPAFSNNTGRHHISNKQLSAGLNTAAAWFCFGVGLDFVSRKVNFFKSPVKNSFALNGIIASTAGVLTGCKALKKNANNKN